MPSRPQPDLPTPTEPASHRPVLLLTGGPAVGKTTTARAVASSTELGAAIDVDDLRHLVVGGHAAPWEGAAGRRQQRLGVRNACMLARSFLEAGCEVVVADVVTSETIEHYRALLDHVLVVQLTITLEQAERRAMQRPTHLTSAEFRRLHDEQESDPTWVDASIEVSSMTAHQQVSAVGALWLGASP